MPVAVSLGFKQQDSRPIFAVVKDDGTASVSLATLEQALAWARRAATGGALESGGRVVIPALEEGILSKASKAPIRWPEDLPDDDSSEEQRRRAALIAGHLVRDRLLDGIALSEPVFLATIAYASALATPQAQHILAGPDAREFLKAHMYACILSERHGHEIAEREETWLFAWLLAQADLPLTTTLDRQMLLQRARRQQRLRS